MLRPFFVSQGCLLAFRRPSCRRRFLHHHMRIRAPHAKRAHPGDFFRGSFWVQPGGHRCWHSDWEIVPINVGCRLVQVEMGWNDTMLHRQDHLDQPGNTGGFFQVAEVGLHGAHQQGCCALPKDCCQRPQFNRIAQGGAGAVGIYIADLSGRNLGLF